VKAVDKEIKGSEPTGQETSPPPVIVLKNKANFSNIKRQN